MHEYTTGLETYRKY